MIEPSKRIGDSEELRVSLPYSNESFGVPKNLYIIGTMNTADRSIALLDTALRRRFEFIELMPDSSKINNDYKDVNLLKLLDSINNRIEFLLDREHTIGHAFFIDVKNLEDLKNIFAKKIIPLLQEYFYEDYAKIDAVPNGNKMVKKKKDLTFSRLFGTRKFNDFDSEKVVYEITKQENWTIENFKRIYDNNINLEKENEQDEA
ncbi:hypothetical protein [uncultured Helicobacter sp.]|uniref:hypothetical protein n=1 Tax=uncultured Helicobacter sp. TaxID=175537 RepID=UPI0026179B16|nr:hypothetical protein [uncultured Helicobacter sp.]